MIAETNAIKNGTAVPPASASVPSGDGWRNVIVTEWTNANGEIDYTLGTEDEYVFTAVIPTENATYVGAISDVRLNLMYFTNFHIIVYVPYDKDIASTVTVENINGANLVQKSGKVLIDGEEFYALRTYNSTTEVFNESIVTINFTVDGIEYSERYNISGLVYADIVLNDKDATDLEKLAVGNMVRFVREAILLKDNSADYKVVLDAIDTLIGSKDGTVTGVYTLPEYIANEDYPNIDNDYSAISEYIESIHLRLSGNNVAYVFTKTDKAIAESATISVSGLADVAVRDNTATYKYPWTLNLRVYEAIGSFTVTVNVPAQVDAETGETVEAKTLSATYSIGAYINATDNELAKAFYAFGAAAKNYRDNRKDY